MDWLETASTRTKPAGAGFGDPIFSQSAQADLVCVDPNYIRRATENN